MAHLDMHTALRAVGRRAAGTQAGRGGRRGGRAALHELVAAQQQQHQQQHAGWRGPPQTNLRSISARALKAAPAGLGGGYGPTTLGTCRGGPQRGFDSSWTSWHASGFACTAAAALEPQVCYEVLALICSQMSQQQ